MDSDKVAATAYKVADKGHPISYLIGADGRIALVKIGFSESTGLRDIETALAKLGVR